MHVFLCPTVLVEEGKQDISLHHICETKPCKNDFAPMKHTRFSN